MTDLKEIKRRFDLSFAAGEDNREKAANDLVFYFVTHWDDDSLSESDLTYKGEFDILKKAGRHIISELNENPVQVDFEPKDPDRKDAGDIADGLYRTDDASNTSIEAYENGKQETIVCGSGAWKLYTEYESLRNGDRKQVVKRRPIFEACSTVFWDNNAVLLDKSDAAWCFILTPYSEDAYKQLVSNLTGEDAESVNPESFNEPDFDFKWYLASSDVYYVAEYYETNVVKSKIFIMADPFGDEIQLNERELKGIMDDMIDEGFTIISEKEIIENEITKYIVSGKEILWEGRIPGQYIPVVPCYGERAYVGGKEHTEGVVRLAKDPQRLRDFGLSYIADIVSKSPRPKPIFWPEQLEGYSFMYEAGAQYPYLFMNRKAKDSSDLPIGPVSQLPEQQIPQSLITLVDATRQAVEDVANPGLPQDVADPDMSGKAIYAIQARMDQQYTIYQTHFKHAKRRDGMIWASIASEIYDTPRTVFQTKQDGTRVETRLLDTIIDKETGDTRVLNDIRDVEFNVYSNIGPGYASKKQQTIEQMTTIATTLDPGDPMRKALNLKTLEMMDGVDFDDIREVARKQLILSGFRKPETVEEEQMVQAAQSRTQEKSAEMVLAEAEVLKGQAEQMREKRETVEGQAEIQLKARQIMIDEFNAQTKRMEVELKANESNAKVTKTDIESMNIQLDNKKKAQELYAPLMQQ